MKFVDSAAVDMNWKEADDDGTCNTLSAMMSNRACCDEILPNLSFSHTKKPKKDLLDRVQCLFPLFLVRYSNS